MKHRKRAAPAVIYNDSIRRFMLLTLFACSFVEFCILSLHNGHVSYSFRTSRHLFIVQSWERGLSFELRHDRRSDPVTWPDLEVWPVTRIDPIIEHPEAQDLTGLDSIWFNTGSNSDTLTRDPSRPDRNHWPFDPTWLGIFNQPW